MPMALRPRSPRVLNDLAIRFCRTRVPTRFEQKYVLRGVHLELGGVKSDEATHEGDLVGETQSIVGTPPQGDLASVGFEKAGIANQTAGERRKDRRPAGVCQEQTARFHRAKTLNSAGWEPAPSTGRAARCADSESTRQS